MHVHPILTAAVSAFSLAGVAAGQVDYLYSNISSTSGDYKDAIVMIDASAAQRPLAQESTLRTATGSVRKMVMRTIAGRPYLYWIDTITDDLWRGADGNANGAIDPSEFQQVFDFDTASDGQLDEAGGVWWACVGSGSGTSRGLWTFTDGNADGDFLDAGESTQVVAGPTFTFGATTASSDDARAVAVLPGGDVIWHEDDCPCWFRTTPGGVTSIYLVYKPTTTAITPAPAANPDFGTVLPAITTNAMDRVAVNRNTGEVFMAINFSIAAAERYVFRCRDLNSDGDVNDAGEVNMFFNGRTSVPMWGPIDDIAWLNGSLHVSYEIDTTADPGSQFLALTDNNNDGDAEDAGELATGPRTASTDDPTEIGITAVPAGTFFVPSCVNADLRQVGQMTAAAAGTVVYSLGDIPASLQNDNTVGFLFLSLTGDSALPIPLPPGNCILGLTVDALFIASAGVFQSATYTSATATLGTLPYPAGLPIGLRLYSGALSVRATDFNVRGVSQTSVNDVR